MHILESKGKMQQNYTESHRLAAFAEIKDENVVCNNNNKTILRFVEASKLSLGKKQYSL